MRGVTGDPGGGRDGTGGGNDSTALDQQAPDPDRPAPREGLDDGRRPSGSATLPHRPVDERGRRHRSGGRAQRRAGPVDQPSDGAVAQPERVRDLVVAAALKRRAQHHSALEFRERCQTGKRGTDVEPPLELVLRAAGLAAVLDVKRVVYRTAELADRDVVDDPVQPCPGVTHLDLGVGECHPRLHQSLLQGIFGARLRWAQPPAIPEQRFPIALNKRLERSLVAGARQLNETAVRLGLKKTNR
jgi:hypothetical protein